MAKYKEIGSIYSELKGFFAEAEKITHPSQITAMEERFNSIMAQAKNVMRPDKFKTDYDTNLKRWNRVKARFLCDTDNLPHNGVIIPEFTQVKPIVKKTTSSEKDNEIERLREIIKRQMAVIDNQSAIIRVLSS